MPNKDTILNAGILIVDDQQANVELLEQVLNAAGYTSIASTQDPFAVCALHRDKHFDLILLDLEMPGMDGFQVMEGLREIETDGYLPVLAITVEAAHKIRALQCGAKDFVSKPFDLAEVLIRVHNLLEVRLLHEAARNHAKALQALALNDPLTGLANRRLLADRMSMALIHAKRNKSAMAVLYLDLDGFKQINDTLGHGVGDLLLKEAARRLTDTVRHEDTVARVGGDEFLIALWHVTGADYAATVAGRAVAAVSRPYSIEGNSIDVTTSVGVSIYPDHGEDTDTLIESADLALYEAKHAGKNAYRLSQRTDLPAAPASGAQARPSQGGKELPTQGDMELPKQSEEQLPEQGDKELPTQGGKELPAQKRLPKQGGKQLAESGSPAPGALGNTGDRH